MSSFHDVIVVMLPLPAQGHISSLLHFSRLLSLRGLRIIFSSSPTHNRQARLRLHGWNLSSYSSITFHDLPIPAFPSPTPTTDQFPAHLQPAFDMTENLIQPFSTLLDSLVQNYRRVVIVHDSLMTFAAELASNVTNAEAYAYRCISAYSTKAFRDQDGEIGNLFSNGFIQFMKKRHEGIPKTKGEICNTFHAIEGEYLEALSSMPSFLGRRLWALGPVFPFGNERTSENPKLSCLTWLDGQPSDSVVYVSFGTNSSLNQTHLTELATGLERSGLRFLWVLRDADRADIFADGGSSGSGLTINRLPEGFADRVANRGRIVGEWVPQVDVLAHRAVGGFLSHCGWNSCMESIANGVPLATWPIHSDQPANARLVNEVLKVGVKVCDMGDDVKAVVVEESLKRLMLESEEWNLMKRRSRELRDEAQRAVAPGGSSHEALTSFIDQITRP